MKARIFPCCFRQGVSENGLLLFMLTRVVAITAYIVLHDTPAWSSLLLVQNIREVDDPALMHIALILNTKATSVIDKANVEQWGVCFGYLWVRVTSLWISRSNGLNVSGINVYPGCKQPVMRDTLWNANLSQWFFEDGRPKEIKHQHQGVERWENERCSLNMRISKDDYWKASTTTWTKFHCKLLIERNWCHAKREARKFINGSFERWN